jgi:Rrf2 family iron-sulfur cluster assembly transcriptional regulator
MRLNKTTHYALVAAVDMARLEEGAAVTVAEVAARHGLPEGVLAKVFQQLARCGIARGTRGVGGGYRLARPASSCNVLEVIEALEATAGPTGGEAAGPDSSPWAGSAGAETELQIPRGLARLFREVDDLARATFASTSLETLARE